MNREETNAHYQVILPKIGDWLLAELKRRGFQSKQVDGYMPYVETTMTDGDFTATSRLEINTIHSMYASFYRTCTGFTVKVCRTKRPITFRQKGDDWSKLPWVKIIAAHEAELKDRLQRQKSEAECVAMRKKLATLANLEVPITVLTNGRYWEQPIPGYERTRQADGQYEVTLNVRCSAEVARQLRDIAAAAKAP